MTLKPHFKVEKPRSVALNGFITQHKQIQPYMCYLRDKRCYFKHVSKIISEYLGVFSLSYVVIRVTVIAVLKYSYIISTFTVGTAASLLF